MKNQKKKGNIMLLVLFVMFISSLLGLLVTQYIKDMIVISGLFQNYYTTYYYAYGGLELGLSQINYRIKNDDDNQNPFGYEDSLVFNSFSGCPTGSCSFALTIEGRGKVLAGTTDIESFTGCVDIMSGAATRLEHAYNIEQGDGFIVPLFYDQSTGFSTADYYVVSDSIFSGMQPVLYNDYISGTPGDYIIKIIDENVENYDVTTEPEIGNPSIYTGFADDLTPFVSSETNKNYLIVANAESSIKQFCLELLSADPDHVLPTKYTTIESVAVNNDTTVAFGALKSNELPSYLIYGTINKS